MTTAPLISRLVEAKEGSRALSDEVLEALGYKMFQDWNGWGWIAPDGTKHSPGLRFDPTRSLDDAVELVPEGWFWSVSDIGEAWIGTHLGPNQPIKYEGKGATPALALVMAILKAMETEGG